MSSLAIENGLYQNPPETSYSLRRQLAPEASYSLKDARPATPPIIDRVTERVVPQIGKLADPRMNKEASEIVSLFRATAKESAYDLSDSPAMQILSADDGSVLIEWQFRDRRLGFNIEPEEGQSGWYYAFSRESGGQCGSGMLSSLDMTALLRLMLANPHK